MISDALVDDNEFNDSDGEDGISLLNYLELQEHKKHTSNSSTEANIQSLTLTSASDPLHTSAPSSQDELVAKALEIIQIARRVAQDELEKL